MAQKFVVATGLQTRQTDLRDLFVLHAAAQLRDQSVASCETCATRSSPGGRRRQDDSVAAQKKKQAPTRLIGGCGRRTAKRRLSLVTVAASRWSDPVANSLKSDVYSETGTPKNHPERLWGGGLTCPSLRGAVSSSAGTKPEAHRRRRRSSSLSHTC